MLLHLVFLDDISIFWEHWKLNDTLWTLFGMALLIIRDTVKQDPWHKYRKIKKAGVKHPPSFLCSTVFIEWKCRCTYCKSKNGRFDTKPSRSNTPYRQKDKNGEIRTNPNQKIIPIQRKKIELTSAMTDVQNANETLTKVRIKSMNYSVWESSDSQSYATYPKGIR